MYPPAGVIPTQPTTNPPAAPNALDLRRRGADRRDLAPADRVEQHPDEQGAGGSQQRVDERELRVLPGPEAAAAVEPEPAEPKEAGAEQHVDRVVRQEGLAA